MDIETTEFDPNKAFLDMVSSHSLEELLSLENNLLSEIKTLDTNMQNLVYENYNKFISATDTIRTMKSNVEGMEEEMSKLSASLQRINGLNSGLNEKLAPRQDEVKRLVDVHEEMQKIKFICDLPALLRGSIESNKNKPQVDFKQAAESYIKSKDFLISHRQDTSYVSIYQETTECVELIKKVIWNKLKDPTLNVSVFNKYTKELVMFGDSSEKLPTLYCNFHKKLIKELISITSKRSNIFCEKNQVVPEALSDFSIDTIDQNVRVSISESFDKTEVGKEGTFCWYINQLHSEVSPQIVSAIDNFLGIFGTQPRVIAFCKEVVMSYIDNVKEKLKAINADIGSFSMALHVLNADMHNFKEVVPATHEFSVTDRFTELFEFGIRFQVSQTIEELKSYIVLYVQNFYQEVESMSLDAAVEKTAYNFMYSTIAAIMELEPIIDSSKDYLSSGSMLVSLIVSHIIDLFQFIELSLTVSSIQYPTSPDPLLDDLHSLKVKGTTVIGLLKLAISLEEACVPKLLSTVTESTAGLRCNPNEIVDIVQRVAKPELISITQQMKERILQIYIEHYAAHFQKTISAYTQKDWNYSQEPIDVSEDICGLVHDFKNCRKELKCFFDGEKPYQRYKARRDKHQVELDMERLLARKTRPISLIKFELNCILGSIIKLCLKNLYEEIRLVEVGTGGYQQIELDTEFLEGFVEELVILEDSSLGSGYIKEVQHSAGSRCKNVVKLDRTLLDTIIENKKESFKATKS